MGGQKTKGAKTGTGGKQILAGSASPERFHHCPECPADDKGNLERMQVHMCMPGRKIKFVCKGGHEAFRGGTILR